MYQVQWFANGAPLWNETCSKSEDPCRRRDHVAFTLGENVYKLGQTVSKQGRKPLSVEMLVAKKNYIIQGIKTSF